MKQDPARIREPERMTARHGEPKDGQDQKEGRATLRKRSLQQRLALHRPSVGQGTPPRFNMGSGASPESCSCAAAYPKARNASCHPARFALSEPYLVISFIKSALPKGGDIQLGKIRFVEFFDI